MNSILQLKLPTINMLAALIIGLFIIFPDLLRDFERRNANTNTNFPGLRDRHLEREQMRPPPINDIPPPGFQNRRDVNPPEGNVSRIAMDFTLFIVLAFSLLSFNTILLKRNRNRKLNERKILPLIILSNLALCFFFLFVYSTLQRMLFPPFFTEFRIVNGMLTFKSLFVLIISLLFSYIVGLIYQQQEIAMENQRLRTENLQNRFDALTSQVNPHFFFNSLNSLSYLVREGESQKSLKYIHGLSDIFRYVLKNKHQELVLLGDEIGFLESFRYLLEIRFENKLFFNLNVNRDDLEKYRLPAVSLQPVIENVVKHNVISEDQPMTINICISNDKMLEISNTIQQKSDTESSLGIGLENLDERYRLLLGKEIDIAISASDYTVKLPMIEVKNADT